MKKSTGKEFKLKIKIEAPVGGHKYTTAKLLEKLMNDSHCFTVNSLNIKDNTLDITYHEYSKEEFNDVIKDWGHN